MEFFLTLTFFMVIVVLVMLHRITRRQKKDSGELRRIVELLEASQRKEVLKQAVDAAAVASLTESPEPESTTPPPVPPPIPKTLAGPVPAAKTIKRTPAKPKAQSKLAETAGEILGKIWNWILVGEEHRPTGVTSEFAIASTWLMRLGILAVVGCAFYFLIWSMERELIGPTGRVAIVLGTGVIMLLGGIKLAGRKYHVIAQGLLGGGVLVLYFGMYAMGPIYNLAPIMVVFGLMLLVTVAAGLLAVRLDSMLIAVIGLAGGYATPVLLSTGEGRLDILFSHMLLLTLGILAVARHKQWRFLNYLGFLFTYGIFITSLFDAYDSDTHFVLAFSFLSAYFVIHAYIVYGHNIARGIASTTLEIIHLTANAVVYGGLGYLLIRDAYGRPYPTFLALGLAIFFMLHVLAFLKRGIKDRPLLITLIALAGAFTTWTLPLVLEKESLTLALALLGFTFVWLGQKMNSNFLQNLGHVVYAAVFFRLLYWDFPTNFRHAPPEDMAMSVYWTQMLDRLWTFGVSIVSVIATFVLHRRNLAARSSLSIEAENDTAAVLNRSAAGSVFYWAAIIFVFVFLQAEFNSMLSFFQPFRLPALTVLWCGLGVFLLREHLRGESLGAAFWVLCAVLLITVGKVLTLDLHSWNFNSPLVYRIDYTPLYALTRLIDFGAVIALLALMWAVMRGRQNRRRISLTFGYAGLALLFIYMTLELNSLLYWKFRDFQDGGMSILWALFAIAFIVGGIWKSVTPLRFIGLMLIIVVVVKVTFIDLREMEIIVKVIALMAVGVILLLGSFAYIHSNKKFERKE